MGDGDGMDCDVDAITAGLARVLLRGDRCAVPRGMQRLELEEKWAWAPSQTYDATRHDGPGGGKGRAGGGGGVDPAVPVAWVGRRGRARPLPGRRQQPSGPPLLHPVADAAPPSHPLPSYLDASCLIFGPGRTFMEAVDYQAKRNTPRAGGDRAVVHSGDVLRSVLCEGTHTLSVSLDRLSPGVEELFICLSAWAGARLGVSGGGARLRRCAGGHPPVTARRPRPHAPAPGG